MKLLYNLLHQTEVLLISDLLSMWVSCLIFAVAESAIFPEGEVCTKGRSLVWLGTANLVFLGGALLFGWFTPIPVWGAALLILFLELGLGLMWFGDQLVLKMDSAQLTRQLKQYQQRRP